MESQSGINFTRQIKAIWRAKWFILIAMVIAGGVSFQSSLTSPSIYEATTTIMIDNSGSSLSLSSLSISSDSGDMTSQIAIMQSTKVLKAAIAIMEPEKALDEDFLRTETESLQSALKILQISNTMVSITITSNDAARAEAQANAIAEAYIYEVNIGKNLALSEAIDFATSQLRALGNQEIDISINPSYQKFIAQIDTTLPILQEVSSTLNKLKTQQSVVSATSIQQVTNEINSLKSRIDRIALLANEISPDSIGLELIKSQLDVIEIQLQSISETLNSLSAGDMDTTESTELNITKDLIALSLSAFNDLSQQVITLSQTIISEAFEPTGLDLNPLYVETRGVITEKSAIISDSLDTISGLLPETTKTTQSQIELMVQKVNSVITSIQDMTHAVSTTNANQEILLTYAELAALENQANLIVYNVDSLLSQTSEMVSDETDSQIRETLYTISELLLTAKNASTDLPDTVVSFSEYSNSGISYATLVELQQQIQLASLTDNNEIASIIEPAAVVNTNASIFTRFRNVLLAVFAVFIFGIFVVVVIEYLDKKVRDPLQVASDTGLPVKAQISRSANAKSGRIPSVLMQSEQDLLEDFRTLRTNLELDAAPGQVLLISSPDNGEGKTTVATNLARVIGLQDRKVLLIDGNLRNPDITRVFNLENSSGLTEFLQNGGDYSSYVTRAEDIDILTIKKDLTGLNEPFSSPRMKSLLDNARKDYDVIIIDSGPLLTYADTKILAKMVDKTLLVLQADSSNTEQAKSSIQTLHSLEIPVSGIALNRVKHVKR